ncbi:hypothetical protein [Pseudomonas sp. ML96]|uniref:hypothetical protein n=1 Tax=Pseudomonas sp. ML96 TaxID=1523503 RepID=UPI0005BD4D91|nr:hypothetical protein [Pseudomonas sp. ML96]
MIEYLSRPQNVLKVSTQLLIVGMLLLLAGIVAGYGMEGMLSIPALVVAHSGVVVGPTLLKIGYVMRLIAQHYLRKQEGEASCATA